MAKQKNRLFIFSFLAVPLLIYLVFYIYPFISAFYYAFTKWSGVSNNAVFVGVQNFTNLLNSDKLWSALSHNLLFIVYTFVPVFAIALTFAFILTRARLAKAESRVFRVLVFIPNVLSVVTICMIWSYVFNPSIGVLNTVLRGIGLEDLARDWLGKRDSVIPSIASVQIWTYIGYYVVLLIAAIRRIPESMFESASIDGASVFRQFRSIALPLIWGIVRITMILFFITAFSNNFAYVNIMTKGGPAGASDVLETFMYKEAFLNQNFGYATAAGFFTFAFSFLVQGIVRLVTKKEQYEL